MLNVTWVCYLSPSGSRLLEWHLSASVNLSIFCLIVYFFIWCSAEICFDKFRICLHPESLNNDYPYIFKDKLEVNKETQWIISLHGDRMMWHDSPKNGNKNASILIIAVAFQFIYVWCRWKTINDCLLVSPDLSLSSLENWSCPTMHFCLCSPSGILHVPQHRVIK